MNRYVTNKTVGQLHLFEAIGIELEYMIVDRDTLAIKPIADILLSEAAGTPGTGQVNRGAVSWSNELVLHLVELKTTNPAPTLIDLHEDFQKEIASINQLLKQHNAMLLPSAMHPWMDPAREMRIWPHESTVVYETYNRIFDCRGHGWANLQSMHINLPFSGDYEFEKLHAAVRVLLPILPGLAASSPIADGKPTGFRDYRMEVYRTNSRSVPSVTGYVIPEQAFSEAEYERKIFRKMYRDILRHDPEMILRDQWLNSRGAIARFDRGSIEIRVLDLQESPLADLAVARFVTDILKALVNEQFSSLEEQKSWNEKSLHKILLYVVKEAEEAILPVIYSRLFGFDNDGEPVSANELLMYLYNELYTHSHAESDPILSVLKKILTCGTLATRILRKWEKAGNANERLSTYRVLAETLANGQLFHCDG
ncbi:MAG: glutamate-cysteine ligase family protein [Balneolaceae bacterium]|nr:glutamate-cysteine ligase family protein [Balneolaceae bacterium]